MAKNDKILIDGIIDDRVFNKSPSNKRDEAFEFFSIEQTLKEFDLSRDEILNGIVDGRQDGGIDGLYIFINGHLLTDAESFIWPKTGAEISVHIFTCKHHDTFKQATLDALIASISEILDFEIDDSTLAGAYSSALIEFRNNLKYTYRRLSPKLSEFKVNTYYISRGDSSDIGEEVRARAKQVTAIIKTLFSRCESNFSFVGSTELVELHRRRNSYTLELPYVESLSDGERYVLLTRLEDYYSFISDQGKLRRYLFESNVRDFMGLNRVNEDIKKTLEDSSTPDFWLLNNGITILATAASLVGKAIQIQDIQIVNGLQTTESIYRYMAAGGTDIAKRSVLVKVIVTNDERVRDAIIRATNNQTAVELASLHATDKIQRDIEDIMTRNGLHYERRKNSYSNLGLNQGEIISPQYVAAGYIALILKHPQIASTIRSKFMRSESSYNSVFSDKTPLTVWPKIAQLLKRIDSELERLRPTGTGTEKFLKKWRYLIGLLICSKHLGTFGFGSNELSEIDPEIVTKESTTETLDEVQKHLDTTKSPITSRTGIEKVCSHFSDKYGIKDIESILFRPSPFGGFQSDATATAPSSELIEKVFTALPPQPWKTGVHRKVIDIVNCTRVEYNACIDRLIDDGRIFQQRDGVLYDKEGNIVGFDADRVNSMKIT